MRSTRNPAVALLAGNRATLHTALRFAVLRQRRFAHRPCGVGERMGAKAAPSKLPFESGERSSDEEAKASGGALREPADSRQERKRVAPAERRLYPASFPRRLRPRA